MNESYSNYQQPLGILSNFHLGRDLFNVCAASTVAPAQMSRVYVYISTKHALCLHVCWGHDGISDGVHSAAIGFPLTFRNSVWSMVPRCASKTSRANQIASGTSPAAVYPRTAVYSSGRLGINLVSEATCVYSQICVMFDPSVNSITSVERIWVYLLKRVYLSVLPQRRYVSVPP